jgi:hypothetical protein
MHVAGGMADVIAASVTRPANTTPYASGDVIGTAATHVLTFEDMARRVGLTGVIIDVLIIDSANQAAKANLELWLFDTPPAAQVDNVAFAPSDAEMETLIGIVDVNATPYVGNPASGADGSCVYTALTQNLPFKCGAASTDLYGVLVHRDSYTPVSAEKFTVRLKVLQD